MTLPLPLPLPEEVSPLSLEDRLNALICTNRSVAGYAIVQPNGSVLVAFGCLSDNNDDNDDNDDNNDNDPSDVVNALLIDQTRTTLTLQRRKMHVVRRAPDMLLAVEALDGARHPVACSAHSISGNNILLVAYGPGGSHEALPLVLSCVHAPPQA